MNHLNIVEIIVVSVFTGLTTAFISAIFESFILVIPIAITDWIFSGSPTIKKYCFVIHATVLGCLVTAIALGYGNDMIIKGTPGIVLGYAISIITNYSDTISEYNKEIAYKRLAKELSRIPKRIDKFIKKSGYKDAPYFEKYFNSSSLFKRARKFKGLQFTNGYGIITDIYSQALQQYQARVNKDLQKHLTSLIPTLQMFGIDDLYELSPAFQDYYHVESITEQLSEHFQNVEDFVTKQVFTIKQPVNPYEKLEEVADIVIVEMIEQGVVEHIPQSGLYKSTKPDSFFSSKDAPGALIEGTTLEVEI